MEEFQRRGEYIDNTLTQTIVGGRLPKEKLTGIFNPVNCHSKYRHYFQFKTAWWENTKFIYHKLRFFHFFFLLLFCLYLILLVSSGVLIAIFLLLPPAFLSLPAFLLLSLLSFVTHQFFLREWPAIVFLSVSTYRHCIAFSYNKPRLFFSGFLINHCMPTSTAWQHSQFRHISNYFFDHINKERKVFPKNMFCYFRAN